MEAMDTTAVARAARLIAAADGLVITAGAGLGVDSGLPDFRGREGFWRPIRRLPRPASISRRPPAPPPSGATPAWAGASTAIAWRSIGAPAPTPGFKSCSALAAARPEGAFVFTSNVDGQFAQAGFASARICRCNGSIHHLQCVEPCSPRLWPADEVRPEVDEAACRLVSDLPLCPYCGRLARPNILMFADDGWVAARTRGSRNACSLAAAGATRWWSNSAPAATSPRCAGSAKAWGAAHPHQPHRTRGGARQRRGNPGRRPGGAGGDRGGVSLTGAAGHRVLSYQPLLALTTLTTPSITGTSISTPTTVARGAGFEAEEADGGGDRQFEEIDAPMRADGQAMLFFPEYAVEPVGQRRIEKTWMRMGTARRAMTIGCLRMASP